MTASMAVSAALGTGLAQPLESAAGGSAVRGLALWLAPVLVAAVAAGLLARARRASVAAAPAPAADRTGILRDRVAIAVTVFFGLQSLSFYAVLGWLPTIYRDLGYSPQAAGLVLSISAFAQMPIALLLPRLATPAGSQRRYTSAATLATAVGLAGILLAPAAAPYLWAVLLGFGQGAAFAVGITLIAVRTGTTADTARLSAMAQTFGYLIAAGGPFLLGALAGATGSWTPGLLLLIALLVPQFVTGLLAARDRVVGARPLGTGTP